MNDGEERWLTSGKAVAAALLLAGILLTAMAVFFFVVFERACVTSAPSAADGRGTAGHGLVSLRMTPGGPSPRPDTTGLRPVLPAAGGLATVDGSRR